MLTQVNTKDFPKLADILKRNIETCNVGSRTSVEYISASLTLHAAQGGLGVWTDNLEDPHALLITTVGKFGVLNEVYCFVNTIYADEGHRSPEITKTMLDTVSLYATAKGCNVIQGSSWLYEGALDISPMWEEFGAVPQEIIHVKKI
tara:strand:- start:2003 stop:2443 length:441 start_codon:yes stop_codon:yes gene_type:complete